MSPIIERLSAQWPTKNPAHIVAANVGVAAGLAPVIGFVPRTIHELCTLYGANPAVANGVAMATFGLTVPVMCAKMIEERHEIRKILFPKKRRARGFFIDEMWVAEKDFWTHLAVYGGTGSGKSSTVIFPVLKALLDIYTDDDTDPASRNPYKKMGFVVFDVKNNFSEYMVYLAHEAGRNSAEEVVFFRPDPRWPIAKFQDRKGRFFFLNAYPHLWMDKVQSSEAHQLYAQVKRPDGFPYAPTMFDLTRDGEAMRKGVDKLWVKVPPDTRFVGWRKKGSRLIRALHTLDRDRTKLDWENDTDFPTELRFIGMTFVNSGLSTNLVKNNLKPVEAASRLKVLTKLSDGGGGNKPGGMDFWDKSAEKQMMNLIAIHQICHHQHGKDCTAIDIIRLTTDAEELDRHIKKVELMLAEMKKLAETEGDADAKLEMETRMIGLRDLLGYFNNEWKKHQQGEGKVANSINSVITNSFKEFMQEQTLKDTYCSQPTVPYKDVFNKGTIICFVPGREYETLARLLVVDMKMDIISMALARKALGYDMGRGVCIVMDEGQEYVISHETVGDNKALSLLREFKTFYLFGTQSDAWLDVTLGKEQARVFRQSYGVRIWLRNSDRETNKMASESCGRIKKEKIKYSEKGSVMGTVTGDGVDAKSDVSYEEVPFIETDKFNFMPIGQGVVLNVGEDGQENQVRNVKCGFAFCTSPEGHAAVGDRLRHYFRELVENLHHKQTRTDRLNHEVKAKIDAAELPPAPEGSAPLSTEIPIKRDVPINVQWVGSGKDHAAPPSGPEASAAPKAADGVVQIVPPVASASVPPANSPAPVQVPAAPASVPTKADIRTQSEEHRRNAARLDSRLDLLGASPVSSHAQFVAEIQEKEKLRSDAAARIAQQAHVGPGGKVLGSEDAAAKIRKPPAGGIIDLATIAKNRPPSDSAKKFQAAAEPFSKPADPEPEYNGDGSAALNQQQTILV